MSPVNVPNDAVEKPMVQGGRENAKNQERDIMTRKIHENPKVANTKQRASKDSSFQSKGKIWLLCEVPVTRIMPTVHKRKNVVGNGRQMFVLQKMFFSTNVSK